MSSGPWTAYASQDEDGPWAKYSQAEQPTESETSPPEPGTWEKLTQSYNPDVENFSAAHPVVGPAVRFLDAAGGAGLSLPSAIYGMARHPLDTAENIGESLAAWGKPETWKGALSVLPEALGQGVGSVAAGEALGAVPGVGKAATAVRDTAGRVLRTPEGELKPLVRATAKVGGIAAGRALGIPGEFAGYAVGPELADAIIPKHPAQRIPSVEPPSASSGAVPSLLPENAFDLSEQEKQITPFEGVGKQPALPSVRRTPGQIAPEAIGAPQERVPLTPMTPPTVNLPGGEAMRGPQPLLPATTASTEASAGIPSVEGPAKPTGTALSRLEGLIREAAGTPELKPNVPLRQQSVGAAGQGFPAVGDSMQNLGGQVSFRREPIIKTVPGLEEGPLRAQPPEKLPSVATEEPARQMGAPPLQPAVPLRQQVKVTGMEPMSEKARLQAKYPDREIRQLAHINGEELYDAAKNDRETLLALTKLENPDMREVAINGGINMVGENGSPIMVNNRKASGDISRQEVFKQLLAKGYTPKQILDLAKQSP